MAFPEGFHWGGATAANQLEGGHDRYRKGSFFWYQSCIATNGEELA